jgi:hypothetical protein
MAKDMTDLIRRVARLEQALKVIRVWAATPEAFGDDRLALHHIADKAKEALEDE